MNAFFIGLQPPHDVRNLQNGAWRHPFRHYDGQADTRHTSNDCHKGDISFKDIAITLGLPYIRNKPPCNLMLRKLRPCLNRDMGAA